MGEDLPCNRPKQPVLEYGMAAMPDDDMIDAMLFRVEQELPGRVPDGDFETGFDGFLGEP
jgi:hypothetical protein